MRYTRIAQPNPQWVVVESELIAEHVSAWVYRTEETVRVSFQAALEHVGGRFCLRS